MKLHESPVCCSTNRTAVNVLCLGYSDFYDGLSKSGGIAAAGPPLPKDL